MRKSTLLWLALAVFCGVSLFHTSQKAYDGREKLAGLSKDIAREEETIRVLQAEWGYLNQPARLEKLAKEYLDLVPMKGTQFSRAEDIPFPPVSPEAEAPVLSPVISFAPAMLPRNETHSREGDMRPPVPGKPPVSVSRNLEDVIRGLGIE